MVSAGDLLAARQLAAQAATKVGCAPDRRPLRVVLR